MIDVFVNPYQYAVNRRIWLYIVLAVTGVLLCMHASGLHLNVDGAREQEIVLFLFAMVALLARFVKRNDMLFFYSNCYAQIIVLYFIGSCVSYLGATLHFPLIDDKLLRMDTALGLHWQDYASWMNTQDAWVINMLKYCYYSFMIQTCLVVSLVFFLGRPDHGQRLVLAIIPASLITALISTFFPAEGVYPHLHIDMASVARLNPHLARAPEELFFALRNRTMDTIYYPSQGIIMMPSFHTIMGILFTYASWPFRWIRPIVLFTNLMLIIATPIYGGHYFMDVFAGIIVAFASIAIAKHILPNNTYVGISNRETKPIINLPALKKRFS